MVSYEGVESRSLKDLEDTPQTVEATYRTHDLAAHPVLEGERRL